VTGSFAAARGTEPLCKFALANLGSRPKAEILVGLFVARHVPKSLVTEISPDLASEKNTCKKLSVCYNFVYEQELHNVLFLQGNYQLRPAPFAPQGAIVPLHPQNPAYLFFANS
jgi:hypothetical protein